MYNGFCRSLIIIKSQAILLNLSLTKLYTSVNTGLLVLYIYSWGSMKSRSTKQSLIYSTVFRSISYGLISLGLFICLSAALLLKAFIASLSKFPPFLSSSNPFTEVTSTSCLWYFSSSEHIPISSAFPGIMYRWQFFLRFSNSAMYFYRFCSSSFTSNLTLNSTYSSDSITYCFGTIGLTTLRDLDDFLPRVSDFLTSSYCNFFGAIGFYYSVSGVQTLSLNIGLVLLSGTHTLSLNPPTGGFYYPPIDFVQSN